MSLAWSTATGATLYLKPGATDFTLAGSYTTDAAGTRDATSAPGSGDVIVLKGNTTYEVDGASASFATLSGCSQIKPEQGAKLVVTAETDARLVAPFYVAVENSEKRGYGTLVKKGAGMLVLGPADTELSADTDAYRYAVNAEVVAGTLRYPENITKNEYVGSLVISNGATVFMPKSPASGSQIYFHHIYAAKGSLITNDTTRSMGTGHVIDVYPYTYSGYTDSEIAGDVGGGVRFWMRGNILLSGTNNTVITQTTSNGGADQNAVGGLYRPNGAGTILVRKFGNLNEPGSIGAGTQMLCHNGGGGFRYLGDGETTSKALSTYSVSKPLFIDGGPNGGLTLTGSLSPYSDANSPPNVRRFFLDGSNRTECVWAGGMSRLKKGDTYFPMHVTKGGSGTWRFAHHDARMHIGGTTAAEGTLAFESLTEKGVMCAFGPATQPTADDKDAVTKGAWEDYSLTLGHTNAKHAATLAYVGDEAAACHTRKMVLAGAGGTLSNGTESARLAFFGISARDAGSSPTLVLDGGGVCTNLAGDISDGAGTLSVTKRGAGTWKLSRDLTFSGDLRVENGTLLVEKKENVPFTWFRYSICQLGVSYNTSYKEVSMRELALYDATGTRQNIGLVPVHPDPYSYGVETNAYAAPSLDLQPGQVAYGYSGDWPWGTARTAVGYMHQDADYATYVDIEGYFNDWGSTKSGQPHRYHLKFTTAPHMSEPGTWITLVMRLPNGVPPITHFDLQTMGNVDSRNNWPKYAVWEGSTDGIHWNPIYDNRETGGFDFDYSYTNGKGQASGFVKAPAGESAYGWYWCNLWLSDAMPFTNNATLKRPLSGRTGYAFSATGETATFSSLANVRSVSVAAGATLATEDGLELPALAIDANGMGTIDGFTFAADGALEVLNASDAADIALPGNYVNCTGQDNLQDWSLTVNGKPTMKRQLVNVNGVLHLIKRGSLLIVR